MVMSALPIALAISDGLGLPPQAESASKAARVALGVKWEFRTLELGRIMVSLRLSGELRRQARPYRL
jgi:hypothetical protein